MGRPLLIVLAKMRGAWPSHAMPYSVRDAAYKSELPAEKAAMRMTALMMLGRALMPARWMPMTQGEAAASLPPLMRRWSLGETMRDMTKTPTT